MSKLNEMLKSLRLLFINKRENVPDPYVGEGVNRKKGRRSIFDHDKPRKNQVKRNTIALVDFDCKYCGHTKAFDKAGLNSFGVYCTKCKRKLQ